MRRPIPISRPQSRAPLPSVTPIPTGQAAVPTLADLRRQLEAVEPVGPVDRLTFRERAALDDRRGELRKEIDLQAIKVRELDVRLSAKVCEALSPLHRRLVARLGRALREVGR